MKCIPPNKQRTKSTEACTSSREATMIRASTPITWTAWPASPCDCICSSVRVGFLQSGKRKKRRAIFCLQSIRFRQGKESLDDTQSCSEHQVLVEQSLESISFSKRKQKEEEIAYSCFRWREEKNCSLLFVSLCLCRLCGCSAGTKATVTASSLDLGLVWFSLVHLVLEENLVCIEY